MFGLPAATVAIIFGIPAVWVIYTLVFVYLSRGWKAEDVAEDRAQMTGGGPGGDDTGGDDTGGPTASANGGAA